MKDLFYYGRMTERYEEPSVMEGRIPLAIINELYLLRDNDEDAYDDRLDDAEEYSILFGIMEDFSTREQFEEAMKAHGSVEQEEYWFGIGLDPVAAKLGFLDCE